MKPVSDRTRQFHETLFGQLDAPEIPRELASQAFFEGILEHATDALAPGLAPAFESLVPVAAPEDACWQEVDESVDLAEHVDAVLPGPGHSHGAPGWMWTRIREDLRGETRRRRRKSARARLLRYAAAAILVLSFALGTTFLLSEGTNTSPEFVFREDPGLHSVTDGLLGRRF